MKTGMKRKLLGALALVLSVSLTGCGSVSSASGAGKAAGAASKGDYAASVAGSTTHAEQISGNAGMTEGGLSGEAYLTIDENRETSTQESSMLTFSLKVDTASYSNVQRYLESGLLPPADAVRTEELINYFRYDQPVEPSADGNPFSLYTETAISPFDPTKVIALVRVKTPDIDKEKLPPSNLTFLIDTSGSMESYDKLPLLKRAFSLLVETLGERDRVSIVTYAGSAGIVLDSASGSDKEKILSAIDSLGAGGSTAGAEGIETAYRLADKNYIAQGNNRVILATDGDFNVGPSSNEDLSELIREKKDGGVYLSIFGFGTGNIRDDLMETLSKDGNGNYAYINSLQTAQKVLVEELASSLFTVADDVKAQIEFNPMLVASYRQIGYENRALDNEDFADDTKDAGEIGVGTDVVALFELTLLEEQKSEMVLYDAAGGDIADELFRVRIRYKEPGEAQSKLTEKPVAYTALRESGSSDLQFASAVAAFGQQLRGSGYAEGSAEQIASVAEANLGADDGGYRLAFLKLVEQYRGLVESSGREMEDK